MTKDDAQGKSERFYNRSPIRQSISCGINGCVCLTGLFSYSDFHPQTSPLIKLVGWQKMLSFIEQERL